MKRSEINRHLREAEAFLESRGFKLPPFAFWTPAEWKARSGECEVLRRKALGWDITDFGSGDFESVGLLLFTLRNGDVTDPLEVQRYAEKIMVVKENQLTPWHFHRSKAEDIINRSGGELVIELAWASAHESSLDDRTVEVWCDGVPRRLEARGRLSLSPGESITIPPLLYHRFFGLSGGGDVLVGEVSTPNDDTTDNRFLEAAIRYLDIVEDEEPYRLLCHELPSS